VRRFGVTGCSIKDIASEILAIRLGPAAALDLRNLVSEDAAKLISAADIGRIRNGSEKWTITYLERNRTPNLADEVLLCIVVKPRSQ
jgi:hypothetical protein